MSRLTWKYITDASVEIVPKIVLIQYWFMSILILREDTTQ